MKNKMTLLVLGALTALVLAALPAVASAGEPTIDPASGKFPVSFTMAGTTSELRATGEPSIICTSSSGSGKYTSATTGEFELTFSGCNTTFFGFPVDCHSTGQANNVITTGTSVFHNTYLTDAKTTPGILVTPPSGGEFSKISCGGILTFEVKGNGIIGHLETPKCGASSKTATLSFTATGASQTFKQVTATGTSFDLTATTSGGSPVTAAWVTERTVTFAESVTLTCV